MEASIQGFGHGAVKHHQLADALVVNDAKSHSTSKSEETKSDDVDHRSVDTYTNAQGVTQTARDNAPAAVTTRQDKIAEHLETNRKSTSVRNGDTTKTHTDATADLDKTDHATVTNANGTTTIDAHKEVDAKSSSDSTSVRTGNTTKTDSTSAAAIEVDNHVVVTNPAGATTTYDTERNVQTSTTADASNTSNSKSSSVKTGDGTLTKAHGESHGSGDSQTEFSIQANGTIVDSHGHAISLTETGHGETDSTWSGSSQGASVTL
ncbi:MAG: hypothetical protein M3N19_07990, partial [Candidatus Eremiobacteraeota bacterium]|nr:hypothetical protein [Candidatus Eremiobacteraeota bacterium]